jgi:hypothetical protein
MLLLKHCINQKFLLLPEVETDMVMMEAAATEPANIDAYFRANAQRVKKFLESNATVMDPTMAAQQALFPQVALEERKKGAEKNKYPVWAAVEFFDKMASAGFGSVTEQKKGAQRMTVKVFNKFKLAAMSQEAAALFAALKVDATRYNEVMSKTATSKKTNRKRASSSASEQSESATSKKTNRKRASSSASEQSEAEEVIAQQGTTSL